MSWARRTFVDYLLCVIGHWPMRKRQVHSPPKSKSSCCRGFQLGCRMVGVLSVSWRVRCGEHTPTMWLRRRHSGDDGPTLSSSSLDTEDPAEFWKTPRKVKERAQCSLLSDLHLCWLSLLLYAAEASIATDGEMHGKESILKLIKHGKGERRRCQRWYDGHLAFDTGEIGSQFVKFSDSWTKPEPRSRHLRTTVLEDHSLHLLAIVFTVMFQPFGRPSGPEVAEGEAGRHHHRVNVGTPTRKRRIIQQRWRSTTKFSKA